MKEFIYFYSFLVSVGRRYLLKLIYIYMITTTYHSFFLDSKSPKLSCRLVVTTIAYDYNNNIYIRLCLHALQLQHLYRTKNPLHVFFSSLLLCPVSSCLFFSFVSHILTSLLRHQSSQTRLNVVTDTNQLLDRQKMAACARSDQWVH